MGSLENLPLEIFRSIAGHVKEARYSLAPLAVASRRCQIRVETISFGSLRINESELDRFSRIVTRQRFPVLRNLEYRIGYQRSLRVNDFCQCSEDDDAPTHGTDLGGGTASEKDFSQFFEMLLTILSALSASCPQHDGIDLDLGVAWLSESDFAEENASAVEPSVMMPERWGGRIAVSVTAVRSFSISDHAYLRVWPQAWCHMLAFFPNLKEVRGCMWDDDHAACVQLAVRNELGTSLALLPNIEELNLTYVTGDVEVENRDREDAMLTRDIFSYELGVFSQRLVKLKLDGAALDVIDFFGSAANTWPHLRAMTLLSLKHHNDLDEFHVNHMAFLACDDGLEDASLDRLPTVILKPAKVTEVYKAITQALGKMPGLVELVVTFSDIGFVGFNSQYRWAKAEPQYYLRYTDTGTRHRLSSGADITVECKLSADTSHVSDPQLQQTWVDLSAVKQASVELLVKEGMAWTRNTILNCYDVAP